MKNNAKKHRKLFIAIPILIVLSLIIYFSSIQSIFDNDAVKHYTFFTGEDVLDGYTLHGENSLGEVDGVGVLNVSSTSNYVSTGYTMPNDHTIQTWAYPTHYDNTGTIAYQLGGSSPYYHGMYWVIIGDGRMSLVYYNGVTNNQVFTGVSDAVPLNEWSHLVATHNGSVAKLYMNGELVGQNTNTPYSTSYSPTVVIGRHPTADTPFGLFADYSIFNRVLNETEIAENYEEQKVYFVNYNLQIYHSNKVNILLEPCTSVVENDLFNTTTCSVLVDENVTILWDSDTHRVTNDPSELTFNMTSHKNITLTSQVIPTSSGGGGSSTIAEEIIEEEIIPEEESISQPSFIDNSLSWLEQYWWTIVLGVMAITLTGVILFRKK